MQLSVWLFKRGYIYYLGWRENGKIKAISTKTQNPQEAEVKKAHKILELKHKLFNEPCPEMLVAEVIPAYIRQHPANASRTQQSNLYTWTKWPHKTVGEFTRINLMLWLAELNVNYNPASVSIHLRNLRKLIRFCIEEGLLLKDPFKRGDIPAKEKVARFLSPSEISQLLSACDNDELKRIIIFTVEVGLRLSQMSGLKWDQVNNLTGFIKIPGQKRQKERTIPISAKAKECMGQPTDGQVFEGWTTDRLKKAFVRTVKVSKISGRVRFHDLRHTAASRLANVLTPAELRDYFGWSSIAMTDIYCHTTMTSINNKLKTFNNVFDVHPVYKDEVSLDTSLIKT